MKNDLGSSWGSAFCIEAASSYVAQAGLKLAIFLPPPSELG